MNVIPAHAGVILRPLMDSLLLFGNTRTRGGDPAFADTANFDYL